jgi:uncharacterized protein
VAIAMSELIINISKLSLGHHYRSLEVEPASIGLDARFNRAVQVQAFLEKNNRQIVLRVQFSTGGCFTCDRCLEEFQREVTSGYTILYVSDNEPVDAEEGEVQVLPPDANTIDLGEDVRQYAVLALPLKMLCREDCAGLCPVCGVNKNTTACSGHEEEIDPRWAVLKQILNN